MTRLSKKSIVLLSSGVCLIAAIIGCLQLIQTQDVYVIRFEKPMVEIHGPTEAYIFSEGSREKYRLGTRVKDIVDIPICNDSLPIISPVKSECVRDKYCVAFIQSNEIDLDSGFNDDFIGTFDAVLFRNDSHSCLRSLFMDLFAAPEELKTDFQCLLESLKRPSCWNELPDTIILNISSDLWSFYAFCIFKPDSLHTILFNEVLSSENEGIAIDATVLNGRLDKNKLKLRDEFVGEYQVWECLGYDWSDYRRKLTKIDCKGCYNEIVVPRNICRP